MDNQLAQALTTYSEKSTSFDKAVADIDTETAATLAEVKAEAAKKVEEAKKSAALKKSTTTPKKDDKKPEPAKEPEPPSLFSQAIEPVAEAAVDPAPVAAGETTTTVLPFAGTDSAASLDPQPVAA